MADKKKQNVKKVADDNGIVNPSGAAILGFTPLYLAFVPLTTYLAKQDGVVQSLTQALIKLVPSVSNSAVTSGRAIPALSAIYIFVAFGLSGAASASAQAMARKEGLDNSHPRAHLDALRGLPLRMRSAHYALMENFPGFALAAALAQSVEPGNAQVVNLLGLHVLAKVAVHYPAYLLDLAPLRTIAHVLATSAVIGVCWRLAVEG